MSNKTHIEWTDATWNPVTGCNKVSAGCKHCYAERDWARLSANPKTRYYGRAFTDVQCHSDVLDLPLRWKRPRRIFVNSMSDLFHKDVPAHFISDVFGVMAATPQHTYQVLTKRPDRAWWLLGGAGSPNFCEDADECAAMYSDADVVWPLPNVWLGVSVEDQAAADERIPLLLQTPAAVHWISAEPLLGPVHLRRAINPAHIDGNVRLPGLDWVVCGGESGPKARPMSIQGARSLRDQCAAAGVPFLFKQWGEFVTAYQSGRDDNYLYDHASTGGWVEHDGSYSLGENAAPINPMSAEHVFRIGKKAAGRLLDGTQHDGYPS